MTAPSGRRSWPKALRHRQFRLWFAGSSLSALGTAMVPVTLTFAVLGRFHTATAVGTVLAAQTAPLALLLLFGGVVGDRVSRRLLLLASDVVSAIVQTLAALLLLHGHWQLWQLAALFAVQGAAAGLSAPALLGMVSDVVPAADRQQANTLRSLASSTALIAGPAVAGVVAGFGGGGLGLGVNAGTYALSAAALAAMTTTPAARPADGTSRPTIAADLVQGWREFRSRSWLWAIVGQFGLFHLLVYPPVMVLGAVVAERHLGGASAWGSILAAFGAGSLAGGLVLLRWHPHRPLFVATVSGFGFAAFAAALALRAPLVAVVVVAFGCGALLATFDVLWNTALTTHVPPDVLSRVSAYDYFGSVVLLPVGYAVVGPVAAAIGIAATLWIAAGAWVVLCAAVLGVRDVRQLERLGPAAA